MRIIDIQYWAGYISKRINYLCHHGVHKTYQRIKERRSERKAFIIELPALPSGNGGQTAADETIKFTIVAEPCGVPAETIIETINFILAQSYRNYELIVLQPKNQDHATWENIKSMYCRKPMVQCIETEDTGNGSAIATGCRASTGDYVIWLRQGDILAPDSLEQVALAINRNPSIELLYTDWAEFSGNSRKVIRRHDLPDISPDYLRCRNYIGKASFLSRRLLDRIGDAREGFTGLKTHGLYLRALENTKHIAHIHAILYWKRVGGYEKAYAKAERLAAEPGSKAIEGHLSRIGYPGRVTCVPNLDAYRIRFDLQPAKVSIIIPNKDHTGELHKCITSILSVSTYPDYEIIIAENNSADEQTFEYYESLKTDPRIKVLDTGIQGYNYSKINNYAIQHSNGEYLILLNNDTQVISPSWIEEMLMYAQRSDVGAVGALLLYPDHTIQHCGLVLGYGGNIAGNPYYGKLYDGNNAPAALRLPQNYSAVTAACMMVSKSKYLAMGGLDENDFAIGLNDVDFCLKLREAGLQNVWTPYAMLYHNESASRGSDIRGEQKVRFDRECKSLKSRWPHYFNEGDPCTENNKRM